MDTNDIKSQMFPNASVNKDQTRIGVNVWVSMELHRQAQVKKIQKQIQAERRLE